MLNNSLGPVVLDISGVELRPDEKEMLCHPQVGGLILFSRNFEHSQQLRDLMRCVREVRKDLVVCVDHEGGRVQRFRQDFTVLPPMQALGNAYSNDPQVALLQARELGWLMAVELLVHDIDLSFAPILDLDESFSTIIGDRAFAADPEVAISLAGAFMDGMHEAGMVTTGKHFPGHGGVRADSHLELPVDERPLQALEQRDLLPYVRLLDKLDAVMSAHIKFPAVDDALVSFSSFWIRDYLKGTLGFNGIVFSDDLSMEGAAGAGSYQDRAQSALSAGCDVVLVCNRPKDAIAVIEDLERRSLAPPERSLSRLSRRLPSTGERPSWPSLHKSRRWRAAVALSENLRK